MNVKVLPTSILILTLLSLSPSFTPIFPSQATATPTIYIDPQLTIAQTGETLSINISISQATNLSGWELKLYYLNALLNGTEAKEGPFLKAAGPTFFWTVSFTDTYNTTHGRIHLTSIIIGAVPGATGNGTLATLTFKAKRGGTSPLTLSDTSLIDDRDPPQEIPHTTIDGEVQIWWHNIAITSVSPSKTIVGQGYNMSIYVTVANQGKYTETFNVTPYANTTSVGTKTVTLTSQSSTTLTFTWNTTGFAKGNYTISAYAWPLPGEIDTADNTFVNGWVIVTIRGDVDGNGRVDMVDIGIVCDAFGSTPEKPNWDPRADLDGDGRVDMVDIGIVCDNFGKKYP